MHNARWKQGKSLDKRREFRRFFLGKVLDKKQFTKLTGYFDQLFATERTNAVELSLLQQASLFQICALLFACSPEKIPSTLENAPLHSKKSVILKYIDEHLADSLTIEQLAKVVYMHPTAFIRYFKNRMGMPPLKYIKYLRLERAKLYLETTDYAIQEIASLTGFTTASHFSREFKAAYGMSPAQDRKSVY